MCENVKSFCDCNLRYERDAFTGRCVLAAQCPTGNCTAGSITARNPSTVVCVPKDCAA